ncbi:MAG: hypothetical protein ACRDY0_11040 [Acidimicrobiales bacterium]
MTEMLTAGSVPGPSARGSRALLVENIHPGAGTVLGRAGFEVEMLAHAPGQEELIDRAADVAMLGIRSGTHLSEAVLEVSPLLVVVAFCIGTNQIDLEATRRHGVAVFNAPFSNNRSVVEIAVAEIIALSRRRHRGPAALPSAPPPWPGPGPTSSTAWARRRRPGWPDEVANIPT